MAGDDSTSYSQGCGHRTVQVPVQGEMKRGGVEGGRGRREGKVGREEEGGRREEKMVREEEEGRREGKWIREEGGRKREEGGRGKWVKGGREKRKLISKKNTMAEDQFKCTCTCRYMNNQ